MQALVKLKEAKAEEKPLRVEEEKKRAEEAAKLAAEEAKKAKAAVREARKAMEVTAVKLGPKVKKAKMDEAMVEWCRGTTPCDHMTLLVGS